MESHYNMLARDAEAQIIPELRKRNMSLLPYWPLANGLLTGKYQKGDRQPPGSRLEKLPMVQDSYSSEHWDKIEKIRLFAEARGIGMVELAFAWLLSNPTVASVIAGATTPEQVRQNATAFNTKLSEADVAELDQCLK
jgi:aryl-alcohol dehydrogenase-like predicted oxidoreductase